MWLGHVTLQCVGLPQTKGLVLSIGSCWGKKKKKKGLASYMICISSFMGPVWLSVFLFLLFSLLIVKNRGKSLSRAHFHASSPNISSKKYLESFTFLRLRKVHLVHCILIRESPNNYPIRTFLSILHAIDPGPIRIIGKDS